MQRFVKHLRFALCVLAFSLVGTVWAGNYVKLYPSYYFSNGELKSATGVVSPSTVSYLRTSAYNNASMPTSVTYTNAAPVGLVLDRWYFTKNVTKASVASMSLQLTESMGYVLATSSPSNPIAITWNSAFDGVANDGSPVYVCPSLVWLTYKLHYDTVAYDDSTIEYGTLPADANYIYTNQVTIATNVPTRAGYSFVGWGTSTNATKRFAAKKVVTGADLGATTNGVTLYANWTQNVYSVTFNYRDTGGSEVSTNETVLGTENAVAPADADLWTDHTLTGWDVSYSNVVSDLTVNARYSEKLYYYIRFIANGGTGTMDTLRVPDGVTTNLPACGFARTGYSFDEWVSDTGGHFGNGKTFTDTVQANHYANLTAQWQANTYEICFAANGGTGTMTSQTNTYDQAKALKANAFVRTGYTFKNWKALLADGSVTNFANEASVLNLVADSNGRITLTAQWTANGYTVAFDANGGTGTMASTNVVYDATFALPESAFAKTGYTFQGWGATTNATDSVAAGSVVSNLTDVADATNTFYAVWQANVYQADYHPNGATSGEAWMTNTFFTFDQPAPLASNTFARTGYAFAGWNTVSNGTGTAYADQEEVVNLATNQNEVANLWAQWTPVRYTIHFDANGGEGTMEDMVDIPYGVSTNLTANAFVRAGRQFNGWNNGTYADGAVVSNLASTDGAVVTLTASWELADGDLRAALDLSATDETLALETDYWSVTDNDTAEGETCLKATGTSELKVNINANGTLSFNWQTVNNTKPLTKGYSLSVSTTNNTSSAWATYENETSTEWASDTITVTNAPICLVFKFQTTSTKNGLYALLDKFVWTPSGASPEPTADDAPVITALTSSDSRLALSFRPDARFDYQLLGTNVLVSGEWPVIENITVTNDPMTVEGLFKTDEPKMFYKVRVIQKK